MSAHVSRKRRRARDASARAALRSGSRLAAGYAGSVVARAQSHWARRSSIAKRSSAAASRSAPASTASWGVPSASGPRRARHQDRSSAAAAWQDAGSPSSLGSRVVTVLSGPRGRHDLAGCQVAPHRVAGGEVARHGVGRRRLRRGRPRRGHPRGEPRSRRRDGPAHRAAPVARAANPRRRAAPEAPAGRPFSRRSPRPQPRRQRGTSSVASWPLWTSPP